jgi:hypothetical protein
VPRSDAAYEIAEALGAMRVHASKPIQLGLSNGDGALWLHGSLDNFAKARTRIA